MRILFATDGSDGALGAARFLSDLPHRSDVHVHVFTVLDVDDLTDGSEILRPSALALGSFPGQLTTGYTHAETTSDVIDTIVAAADYSRSDLIVVGGTGKSAIARFLMGSVAEGVARHAKRPVLVGRDGAPDSRPMREVVVGMDGSAGSAEALRWLTTTFPLPTGCAIRLLRVVPTPVVPVVPNSAVMPGAAVGILEDRICEAATKTRRCLEEQARDLADAHGLPCVAEVRTGNAALELIDAAEESHAGLIAVGAEGLTGFARFLLGSVSERVLRHAGRSVLVVKRQS